MTACAAFLHVASGNARVSLVVLNGIESMLKHLRSVGTATAAPLVTDLPAVMMRLQSGIRPLLRARGKSDLYRKAVNLLRTYFAGNADDAYIDTDAWVAVTGAAVPGAAASVVAPVANGNVGLGAAAAGGGVGSGIGGGGVLGAGGGKVRPTVALAAAAAPLAAAGRGK